MARRICITGATGFIGASLVARLKDEGHWVRAVDIKPSSLRFPLYKQADQVQISDLRDSVAAEYALRDVDEVYHLAADHGGAGYFYSDADLKASGNNLLIDLNVLRALGKEQRLFFASSACTYPMTIQGEGAKALRESDWGGGPAEQLYGEAKRMSTLRFEGAREHGYDARSAVFHTIYGPFQEYEEPRAKFPTALCRKLLADPTRVEVWGDGTQVRTFLFIEDALDRIQTVMNQPYQGPVNLGSDEQVSVAQCCGWAAESAGASPEWVYTDGPTGVAHRAADNTEWDRRYGASSLTTAACGFDKLYRWMERNVD